MRFFAFDSFEGLPCSEGKIFNKGDYLCPYPLFEKIVKHAGVNLDRINIIKGYYDRILHQDIKKIFKITKASIVHIDCDLYQSAKEVLAFIEDIVGDNTVQIFDNWYSFYNETGDERGDSCGEQLAFKEWKMNTYFKEFYDLKRNSRSFVMKNYRQ